MPTSTSASSPTSATTGRPRSCSATSASSSVRLLTNNPVKVEALSREGIEVVERVAHAVAPNRHNHGYLATKARRAGHLFEG